MSDNPFKDFYAANDECINALAANNMAEYAIASAKLTAAMSRIKPPQVPASWQDDNA